MTEQEEKSSETTVSNEENSPETGINPEAIKAHLGQNAEFVIDLTLRIGAFEKLLISKGILTEAEVQATVLAMYTDLLKKAEQLNKANENG